MCGRQNHRSNVRQISIQQKRCGLAAVLCCVCLCLFICVLYSLYGECSHCTPEEPNTKGSLTRWYPEFFPLSFIIRILIAFRTNEASTFCAVYALVCALEELNVMTVPFIQFNRGIIATNEYNMYVGDWVWWPQQKIVRLFSWALLLFIYSTGEDIDLTKSHRICKIRRIYSGCSTQ